MTLRGVGINWHTIVELVRKVERLLGKGLVKKDQFLVNLIQFTIKMASRLQDDILPKQIANENTLRPLTPRLP